MRAPRKILDAELASRTIHAVRTQSPLLLECDQVSSTQRRCFLLERLVRRIRCVLIQYLVETDDFFIVSGSLARIYRNHDRVTVQRCSHRRVEYGPADLPTGEN